MDILYINVITKNCNNMNWYPVGCGGQVLVGSPNYPTNIDTKSPGKARLDYHWRQVLSGVVKDEVAATIQSRRFNTPPPPYPQSPIRINNI